MCLCVIICAEKVMDKDVIGFDDLIGKTTIDLEDRWFDQRWQEEGRNNMILPTEKNPTDCRWRTNPGILLTYHRHHNPLHDNIC